MISIRTALVLAAFIAMGLTSVAEHLARTGPQGSETLGAADAGEAMPGKVLLTQHSPAVPAALDPTPWI